MFVMSAQTRARRRSSFNRSARLSASRRCSSVCWASPSWSAPAAAPANLEGLLQQGWSLGSVSEEFQRLFEPDARVLERGSPGRLLPGPTG